MQEPEMKIISQKQSFWWKIGGWLPVVIMSGIFFSLAYVLQSIPHTPSPVSTGTGNVSDGVAWTSWVPLVLFMVFVFVAIAVTWTKKEALQKWLKEKEKTGDEAKWFWYIVVAIITISASYVAPDKYNIVVAFVVALFGLHIVWLFLITAKTSTATKALVTGFFSFVIVAGLLPGTSTYVNSKWRVVKKNVAVESAKAKSDADAYEKGVIPTVASAQQVATAPAVYQPETRKKKVTVTQNEFTEVHVPPGAVASFDCPYGAIARYYYTINGGPLQREDHDCVEPINIAGLGLVSNFRIAFSSKTEVPQEIEYKITF